jgi:phage terminase small subunit
MLTPKQEAFAQHYALHTSATAAYRAAGYATKSAKSETIHRRAIEVLQNGKVAARIEQLKQRIQERAEHIFDITADRILQELAAIGFANMEDFVTIDANGQPELDLGALERHQWAAVGEFTIDESGAGERASKRTRFKLLDKKGALVELGKYAGVLTEKHSHEHSHKHEVISTIAREFDAGLDQFFARTLADDGGGKTTNRTRRAH